MSLKIFYLTTEIIPFANTSSLADFSAKVPLLLQNKENDIRTIIPKYGYVSERKYILREVIRLREIPFQILELLVCNFWLNNNTLRANTGYYLQVYSRDPQALIQRIL